MTAEYLLKQAVESFKDQTNKLEVIPYASNSTNTGYKYFVLENNNIKTIDASIHLNSGYIQTASREANKGVVLNYRASIQTREALPGDVILRYREIYFMPVSFNGYNEKMGQYDYEAEAFTADQIVYINNDLNKVNIGYSSYEYIAKLISKNYFIVPVYYSLTDEQFQQAAAFLEVTQSTSRSLIMRDDTSQLMEDEITITLINYTRDAAIQFQKDFYNQSLESNEYGLVGNFPVMQELQDIDEHTKLKNITYKLTANVSYVLKTKLDNDKIISNVVLKYHMADNENDRTINIK